MVASIIHSRRNGGVYVFDRKCDCYYNGTTKVNTPPCPFCGKESELEGGVYDGLNSVDCDYCGKEFCFYAEWRVHMYGEFIPRPHKSIQCPTCGVSLDSYVDYGTVALTCSCLKCGTHLNFVIERL